MRKETRKVWFRQMQARCGALLALANAGTFFMTGRSRSKTEARQGQTLAGIQESRTKWIATFCFTLYKQ